MGKDVAMALGYSNTRDALSRHVDVEDKGVVNHDTQPNRGGTICFAHVSAIKRPVAGLRRQTAAV